MFDAKRELLIRLSGLYPINDSSMIDYERLPDALEFLFHNGVTLFQLREKTLDKNSLIPVCRRIREICDEYKALFLVDDDVDFASFIGADGVHLGKDDMHISEARAKLGAGKIIGVSCYGDVGLAVRMQKLGADYVAFGSFFPSKTKPLAANVSPMTLMNAKEMLDIPICAIGGINDKNARELLERGADMVAVISDLWEGDNLDEKMKKYKRCFVD